MAISQKAIGTWAELTADGAVTIPGSPAAGDRMYLFASWKDFSITAQVSGWTEVTEYADGAVANGNGTGSMKVGCWYRDWQSGDGNPTLDFSASPNVAQAVIEVLQKGAGEAWDTPLFATAPHSWTTSSTTTSATSGTVAIPDGAIVMALVGVRDDSATFTRPTSGIDVASGITWNGNYVESPASHASTTTANDMAADLGHRLVTTGGTVTLRATGTLAAAETGAILWVVQGLSALNPDKVGSEAVASSDDAGRAILAADSYATAILADSPLAYFRHDEPSGAEMLDALGAHDGTYAGSPTLGAAGAISGDTAVTLDGTSAEYGKVAAWLTVPNKPISLECWAKRAGLSDDVSLGGWFHQLGVMACQLYVLDGGGGLTNLRIGTENGNANTNVDMTDGGWHHVVGTIDSGGNARLYFDGTLVAGPTAVTFSGGASDNPFKVGTYGADGSHSSWLGGLDEWAVYGIALSGAQVAAHFAAAAAPTAKVGTDAAASSDASAQGAAQARAEAVASADAALEAASLAGAEAGASSDASIAGRLASEAIASADASLSAAAQVRAEAAASSDASAETAAQARPEAVASADAALQAYAAAAADQAASTDASTLSQLLAKSGSDAAASSDAAAATAALSGAEAAASSDTGLPGAALARAEAVASADASSEAAALVPAESAAALDATGSRALVIGDAASSLDTSTAIGGSDKLPADLAGSSDASSLAAAAIAAEAVASADASIQAYASVRADAAASSDAATVGMAVVAIVAGDAASSSDSRLLVAAHLLADLAALAAEQATLEALIIAADPAAGVDLAVLAAGLLASDQAASADAGTRQDLAAIAPGRVVAGHRSGATISAGARLSTSSTGVEASKPDVVVAAPATATGTRRARVEVGHG